MGKAGVVTTSDCPSLLTTSTSDVVAIGMTRPSWIGLFTFPLNSQPSHPPALFFSKNSHVVGPEPQVSNLACQSSWVWPVRSRSSLQASASARPSSQWVSKPITPRQCS